MDLIQKRHTWMFGLLLMALSFMAFQPPATAQDAKVPLVICTAMGTKTIYVSPAEAPPTAHRRHCPLCLFFADSPLCAFIMKLIS